MQTNIKGTCIERERRDQISMIQRKFTLGIVFSACGL